MDPTEDIVLMNHDRVGRSLKRMAHEIVEKNKDNLPILFLGINERGHTIANNLVDILSPIFQERARAIQLSMEKGKEDRPFKKLDPQTVKQSFLVVVDDVIFSGLTMFTALKKITNYVDPSEIHTVVLIDRGHRKFPIKAEFYGMNLPTKQNEHVRVVVKNNGIEKVVLKKT